MLGMVISHTFYMTINYPILRAIAWASVLLVLPTAAQEPSDKPVATAPATANEAGSTLTVQAVTARLATIEGNSAIEDTVKELLRSKYEEAIQSLKEAEEDATTATTFGGSITTAPAETARIQTEQAALPSAESADVVTFEGSVEDLQQLVESSRAAQARLRGDQEKAAAELTWVKGRPLEVSARLPVVQRELADTRARLASPDFAPDPNSLRRTADRLVQQAAAVKLVNEQEMLKQEQQSQSVRAALAQARADLLTRQAENSSIALETLVTVLNTRLATQARQTVAQAEATVRNTADGDESLKPLAKEIESLAKEYETVVGELEEATEEQKGVTERIALLARKSEVIRQQSQLGRVGETMGRRLFDLRQRLPSRKALELAAIQRREVLEVRRLEALTIEEKVRGQQDFAKSFSSVSSSTATELLTTRQEMLAKLNTQYGALVRSLASIDADEGQYSENVRAIRAFVEKDLFWVKCSPPLSGETFLGIPAAIDALFGPANWAEFRQAIRSAFKAYPTRCAAFGVLLLGLLLARRRLGKALERTGTLTRRISTDRYGHTVRALYFSVLLALPIPLLLAGVSWALAQATDPTPWLRSMSKGFQLAAILAVPLQFMSAIYRPGGLGITHFGWRKTSVNRLRRTTPWFTAVYIPAMLVVEISFLSSEVTHLETLGRACFLLAQVWAAMILWFLFRPSDGILAPALRERPAPLLSRYFSFLLIGFPLVLVVLTCHGFLFTAATLSLESLMTAAIIAGAIVLYWLTLRWFAIRYRKLSLAEALAERDARREAAAAQAEGRPHDSSEVVSVDEEDEVALSSLSDQTRRLLQFLFSVGCVIAIGWYWSRTIPLFSALDEIRLAGGLSLLDLGHAALIMLVTTMSIRNLPGLLGIALLEGKEIGAGTRVAIVSLCQYALVAIGLALLFSVLNVDWAKFGWIAAALSVGLGFGLQEVVANFVCGLLLLFERPIRVGDVVTIEGNTGTVTRIQMRATTIINWDRQELVVPNKNLVTGTILNWTLTAALNRIVLKVGVAYGTDLKQARQVLLDVAADHPLILDDPAPMASFDEFADSSLNLSLRAYLPDMDNRVETITELNDEIDRRFDEADIEIAFPQRDLHLRTMAPGAGFTEPAGSTSPDLS